MKKTLTTLAILAAGPAGAAVTAGNLLAFYDFNGNANDGSGNGANATLAGGAVISADGAGYSGIAGDTSLDLGASGNAARADATVDFSSATGGNIMSVSFWQYDIGNGFGGNVSTTAFGAVSSSGGGARGFQAHTPWSDGTLYFDHGGACCGGGNRLTTSLGTSLLDDWAHIVLQVADGNKQIWINGTLASEQAAGAVAIPSFTGQLMIGAQPDITGNGLGGRIDEFAVWNAALSPEDISALAGGASTQSILVPETSSGIFMLLGGLAMLRRRR